MSEVPICIDVSHHQGTIDWEEVRAAGVLGMIHKATEGTSFVDDMRAENCAAAKKAGIAISTYFWLKPGNAAAQADFYLETIQPVKGERVVIDFEEDGCDLDDLYEAIGAIKQYDDSLQITVYSGHLLKELLTGRDDYLADNTDLWLAQYTSSEDNISWSEATYPQWMLWQYSESGTIPGIDDAYVDLDKFNGGVAHFLRWMHPKGHAPDPKPPQPPEPDQDVAVVDVAVTAPDDVKVKVSINGVMLRKPRWRQIRRGPDVAT